MLVEDVVRVSGGRRVSVFSVRVSGRRRSASGNVALSEEGDERE